MNAPLPSEIKVRDLMPGGVRYELPRRPLGPLRWIGLLPLGFGAFFSGFAVLWMIGAALTAGGALGWLFVLWGVPFVIAGCIPMAIGLFIFAGRSVIELRDGKLRAIEEAGPIHWSRARPMDSIARFVLKTSPSNQPVPPWLAQAGIMSGLMAECRNQKPLVIAPGYPHAWTAALAAELARRCALSTPSRILQRQPVPVDVVEMSAGQTEIKPVEYLDQPAGSDIVLEATGDGVVLTIPPQGLWRGSKGLMLSGLIWCAVMTLFTVLVVGVEERPPWPVLLFLAGFWLIGIAMLVGAVNMGRRRATLTVRADGLSMRQVGLLGAKQAEWNLDQIASIAAGPSGMEINGVPVLELQIQRKDGRKTGFLAGRSEAELQWLAAVLRYALVSQRGEPH